MSKLSTPAPRQVRLRSLGMLALFVIGFSIVYPGPLNWLAEKSQSIVGIKFGSVEKPFVLGLDLQSGTRLEYEADVARVAPNDRREALNGVRDVIERRVNTLGVSEPVIQTVQAGEAWRVNVELAGVKDVGDAIELIGETPILEFKEENPEKTKPLTPEQRAQMLKNNTEAKKRAEVALVDVRKKGADFSIFAKAHTEEATLKEKAGDMGFIKNQPTQNDLYTEAKTVAVGTIIPRIVERANWYSVVKVEAENMNEKEISAHHLLLGYKGAQGDFSTFTKEEAKKRIEDLKKRATPANFEKLVAENSQEPGAVESKGDLGWFGKGDMVEPFEKAVFAQTVGSISDVVETPFGFHLIWKNAERPIRDVRVRTIDFKKTTEEELAPKAEPWKATKLTGRELSSARLDFDQRTGAIQVAIQFNETGAKLFAEITKRNVGKPLAIFLDGQLTGNPPIVQTEILGGQAVITGNYNVEEAKLLARRLQAGALPVPVKLIAQQTVGPILGADSLRKSLHAGLVGFLLVALYMIVLYRLPGIMSIIALALYGTLSLMFFKLIPVTLTLAGIAGFILSIGIAVDANVLVFERLKEEWREGKGFTAALEDAFRRAWPSIRDGHVTVLISCAVLYWFSSSMIKGFALTLAIGTLLSLFTAVVSCRTLLRLFIGTRFSNYNWIFLRKSDQTKV